MKEYDHKKIDPPTLKLRTGKEKMAEYNHLKIEKKWQKKWEKEQIYQAKDASKKPKYYALIEFPYPSGDGLHVGHPRPYIGMDVISRKKRMEGHNVLFPIGWDAFGLPTENYAIKTGKDPHVVTKENSATFKRQIKSLGIAFDWSREIYTTDPEYYKWTQWIFLQFLKKGLAYKAKMEINWCPKDKIGLANEEVIDGACERCGTKVEKREKEQWMLAITKYADRLHKDLDDVDYLPHIKLGQRNWIGRSEGIMWNQKVKDLGIPIEAYDSVPQTFMAQTFCVIAPEHLLVKKLIKGTKYEKPITSFIEEFNKRKVKKGFETENEIEGIFTGRYVDNPFGTGDLPIWIATFVIADYGTGAVNASVHDDRDFAFAKKYNIPLRKVVEPLFVNTRGIDAVHKNEPYIERDAVVCVIKHWSEDKYLCSDFKKSSWKGFIVGGIKKNESLEKTALREIREETGYKNIRFIKSLPKVHSKFYQPAKKENRFAHFSPVYVELIDGDKEEILQEEKDLHDIVWVSKKDVKSFINREDMKRIWASVQGTEKAIVKNGILIQPVELKGREWHEVREDIIKYIVDKGFGYKRINYKLRDWVFSRQRYWGEPIPVIFCDACGVIPVPDKDLPVKLPMVKNYQPTDSGESPLASISKWVNVKCPSCGKAAKRETDTMPNWAGSSWYFLRYTDSKNKKEFASAKNLKYWTPVDWYNGGNEHTTLHLLYSRFWHKFLYDLKLVPTKEPYMKRTSHGMILGEGGVKMSKSLGNVINPDDIVSTYGADTLRIYEMFMGPFSQSVAWSEEAIIGPRRFLEKVWKISNKKFTTASDEKLKRLLHKTIKKVSGDIEDMHFNTAISSMMILATGMEKAQHVSIKDYKKFLQILAPFAPHITDELWAMIGEKRSINVSPWPSFDSKMIIDSEVKIVVQINGKVRAEIMIQMDEKEEEVKKKALSNETVLRYTSSKNPKKMIYVKNRLINIVL